MAEETFSLAVGNLGNLLIQKADILHGGVERKTRRLRDELERMQYFLRDAVKRQANDNTISNWISQLREVAQDAEDVIETFCLRPAGTTRSGSPWMLACFASSSRINAYDPAVEIRSIRTRLRQITRMGERFNWGEGVVSSRRSDDAEWQRVTTPWQNDEHVLGLDHDVLLVYRAILEERIGLSVATIVGLGGIGKTTLARLVYNNLVVARKFDLFAWIHVSSTFSLEEIIKKLVLQLLRPEEDEVQILVTMERQQLPSLRLLLQRRLSGRRYLIVLDDVADDGQREALARVFPNEGKGSRLLITSRNRDITRHAQYVHEMKILDPGKSWNLLLNTAFFRQDHRNCPEHLEHIAREILNKCHGLPSAIKEVGRLLADRQSARQWEDVLQTMDLSVMSDAFELSYHRLPPELKLCFLCLALFKQGAMIRAEKLVQVWIAVGMVPQEGNMEEIAASYLDNLISRYMVQVEDKTKDDRVKNCRIFDVFHKPSLRKAEDEISLEILREGGTSRPIHKPRHRAIYCSRGSFIYSVNQDGFLRSLFFHGGGNFDRTPSYWKSFKLLRVLDFDGFGLVQFPEAISLLKGLRYLGLRNNYIKELPDSLGHLENLKVLDISLNFAVVVPDVIWKMESLRHLYMSEIICRTGLKIDTLKNLRTLTSIPVDNWRYERSSLQMMTNLRKLGIEELNEQSDVSKLLASLAYLENLVCLNLRGSTKYFNKMPSLDEVGYLRNLTQLKMDGLLAALPGVDDFPPNLCNLTLVKTSLDQDPMPILEKLPKLFYLKLRKAYTGDRMAISQQGFPMLQILRMGELSHLIYVDVEEGAMAMLRRWEINSCPHLENPPRRATIID